jgi:hypothetical protein
MDKKSGVDAPNRSEHRAGDPLGASSAVNNGTVEIRRRGRKVMVASVLVQGRTVAITGGWLKTASVFDEVSIDGEVIAEPDSFIRELASAHCAADIFTFSQRIPETQPKYSYPFDWDNAAVLPITTYHDWLSKRVGKHVRQYVKKSEGRGLVAKTVPLDDAFVQGVVGVYNDSPIRQGRRFWHYGKDVATVRAEIGHCSAKSEFIGAYCAGELVGFIKLLRVGVVNDIVLIVTKPSHFDKNTSTVLLAKAVEVCEQRGVPYLTYAKFTYGKKVNSSLTDFKRRHGFERVDIPRYLVPLTPIGRVAVRFGLYRSLNEIVPERALRIFATVRATLHSKVPNRPKYWESRR